MIVLALAVLIVAHGLADALAVGEKGKPGEIKLDGPYVHSVFFYLKKDAPKDEAEALIKDAHQMLAKIETVRRLRVGRPAEKATPKFASGDYQVGLMILFDNYDGLETYLNHDLHKKYVAKHEKYLDKVQVYDFMNQTK
jgi:hypothetical protein